MRSDRLSSRHNSMQSLSDSLAAKIVEILPFPLLILDSEMRVKAANSSFYRTFNMPMEAMTDRTIYELDSGGWNIPGLRMHLERANSGVAPLQDFEIDRDFPVVGRRKMLMSIDRLEAAEERTAWLMLTFNDVSKLRQVEERAWFEGQLLDVSREAIYSTDLDGNIVYWNRAAEEMYGWSLAEAQTLNVRDLNTPEAINSINGLDAQTFSRLAHGETWSEEYSARRRDGTLFPVSASFTPIRDDNGHQIAVGGVSWDITRRKQSDEVMRESDERLRSFYEQPLIGMAITTIDKGVLMVNDKLCEMLGYSRVELMHRTWAELTYPDDLATDVAQFNRVLVGEIDGYSIDKRFIRYDGQTLDAMMTARGLRDAQGNVTHFVTLVQDITARKQAEKKILKQNQQLQNLLRLSQVFDGTPNMRDLLNLLVHSVVETLPSAEALSIWLIDEKLRPLSPYSWFRVTGQPIETLTQALDTYLAGLIYHSNQPQNILNVAQEANHNPTWPINPGVSGSVLGVPLSEESSPGVLIAYNASRTGAFDNDDMSWLQTLAAQAAVLIRNVHLFEQVTMGEERALQLGQQVVDAQENERGHISRELHDEAGQAFTALKIGLELLATDLPPDNNSLRSKVTELVELVDKTAGQIRTIALHLRPPALDAMDLNAALAGYSDDFAHRARISVDYIGTESTALRETAETYLYRFLQEALTNIAKHANARYVWVRLNREEDTITLSVEDDGQGFDPQTAYAADQRLTHIGLSSMRERISLLGGWFELASEPGHGTRLVAHIPGQVIK